MIRLLLVEDDPVDALIIKSRLEQLGVAQIETVDCEEALRELVGTRNADCFDGTIMDVILRYTTPERAANTASSQDAVLSLKGEMPAGFRCCNLMAERGWGHPVLLCSNLEESDLETLIAELPEFVEFCEKTSLSARLDSFLAKVRSWQQALRAAAGLQPN